MPTPSFDPAAYLLAQLNLINPLALLPLSSSNVTISNPIATVEDAATDSVTPAINTTATVTSVDGQGFSGQMQVYYQRMNPAEYVAALGSAGELSIHTDGVTDWASFFTAFNTAYGTNFTEIDYPTTPYSQPTSGDLVVTMAPTSLLFVGSMSVALVGLPAANDQWVNFDAGAIRITVGHMTATLGGQSVSIDGVLSPQDFAIFQQQGPITGQNGTVDGGLPEGYSFSFFVGSLGGQINTAIIIYDANNAIVTTFNPTVIDVVDNNGNSYYSGQIGLVNMTPGTQLLTDVSSLAVEFTAWAADYKATSSDFETTPGAIQFAAQLLSSSATPNGLIGWCAPQGYTTYFGSAASSPTPVSEQPPSAFLDAVLFQTPGQNGQPQPMAVLANFTVDQHQGLSSQLSDAYSLRTGKIIDSAGTVYWSGNIGDLQQIASGNNQGTAYIPMPISQTSGNAYTTAIVESGNYALVIDPMVSVALSSEIQNTLLYGLVPPPRAL